jgi:hypothetical protein
VQTFTDTLGREITKDHFTGNPFGGTPSGESRQMNISVSNLFQGKVIKDGEEKKIDLFTLNLSTSHNFLADSLKWSDLQSSLRASASRNFDFTMTTTHSFYKTGRTGRGRRNEFVWNEGFALPRMVNFRLNARVHLAPPPPEEEEKEVQLDTTALADSLESFNIGTDPITEGLRNFKLPWDLTANFTYNINRNDINNVQNRLDMNLAARLEITRNWRIQYSGSFNLLDKVINYQSFNIYRDLHCWEMSFSWGPNPQGYSFFNFEIRIKEPVLRDIKYTRASGSNRVF